MRTGTHLAPNSQSSHDLAQYSKDAGVEVLTLEEALRASSPNLEVSFEHGVSIDSPFLGTSFDAAVDLAKKSDVAIVAVG